MTPQLFPVWLNLRLYSLCVLHRELIEDGADVNKRDLWDSVPLYYACYAGDYQDHYLLVLVCLMAPMKGWQGQGAVVRSAVGAALQ